MRITTIAVLGLTLSLSACASSLNPFNWGSGEAPPSADATALSSTNPLIPTGGGLFNRSAPEVIPYLGTPVDQVTELVVERTPGGVIIRATGRANRPGVFAARLSPVTEGEVPIDGVLSYRLEAIKPGSSSAPVSGLAQDFTVARALTVQQLASVNTIRVESATNALVSRR
jgi:hypothetical protein